MHRFAILCIFLSYCVLNTVVAQLPADYSLKHQVRQDNLTIYFTVRDADKRPVKNLKAEKTYFWYKSQRVLSTQGGSSGALLDGPYESHYNNKQLFEKGKFRKGLKSGTWKSWNEQGRLRKLEHWKGGKQKGKQFFYNDNGELVKVVRLHLNRSRTETPDSIIDIRGKRTTVTVLDSLGKKISVARYRNGLLHGKQQVFGNEKSAVRYKAGDAVPAKVKKEKPAKVSETAAEKEKTSFREKVQKLFRRKDASDAEKTGKKKEKQPKAERSSGEKSTEKKKADERNKRTSKTAGK